MMVMHHVKRKINKTKKWLFLLNRCIKSFNTFNRMPKFRNLSIILMTYNFNRVGGVEKRIFQYSALLKREGYKVFVAAVDGDGSPDLWLTRSKLLNSILLKILTIKFPIKIIEWNEGGGGSPLFFIKLFKRKVKIGAVLHASHISWKIDFLKYCDYVICSHYTHGIRVPFLRKFLVIANAVSKHSVCYKFSNQREALIISRIAGDKLPSIKSFIELCKHWKINPVIAGDIDNYEGDMIKNMLQKEYDIADDCFIGRVDTVKFLQAKGNKYLFIGGVGQVMLEAGQLGFPCLVCSLLGKNYSFFLTRDNIKKVLELNCSPRSKEEINSIKIENTELMFKEVLSGNIGKFNISQVINKECSIDKAYKQYLQIIISNIESQQ